MLAWVAGEEWKLEAYRRYDETGDPRDEPYLADRMQDLPRAARHLHEGLAGAQRRQNMRLGVWLPRAVSALGGISSRTNSPTTKSRRSRTNGAPRIRRSCSSGTTSIAPPCTRCASAAQVVQLRPQSRCNATGAFLQLQLPSGRKLSYPYPRIIVDDRGNYRVVFADNAAGQFKDCRNGQGAYGGIWTENIVQGIARDLLAEAMLRIEAAGYPIVLHVHDEIVAEVPIGFGSTEKFTELMTRQPSWAEGLPIAASAWTGPRYCK